MSEAETIVPMDTTSPQESLKSEYSDIEANVATPNKKVYKDECLYCYDTPYSNGKYI